MARCQGANLCCIFFHDEPSPSETLGILAFDAAKTMCRLVSLYKSLSDVEIVRLRRHVTKSKSVTHLNSKNECFLLNLACAERLEDLNLAAASVSRLARRAKHSFADSRRPEFGSREMERKIETMEKLVLATRNLHMAMENLTEMESSEKKIQRWRTIRANHGLKVKVECFNDRIMFYRRQVQYFKQISLWNQTFDKVVGLMARIICVVYSRICAVFGSVIMPGNWNKNPNDAVRGIYRPSFKNSYCRLEHRELYQINLCLLDENDESFKKRGRNACHVFKCANFCFFNQNNEPLKKRGRNGCHVFKCAKTAPINFPFYKAEESACCGGNDWNNNRVLRLAPPSTVGGAGLSLRYANLIMLTERCMHTAMEIGDEVRAMLYEMVPGRLRQKLRAKLKSERLKWKSFDGEEEERSAMVTRWRMASEEVMEWLFPVAHGMVRWQAERNLERQKFETRPTVLLLQTLHYSDLEKVEEAIVEVLMGLSCVNWHQKQR
ncbi:hypothetical protein VNO77_20366 [Canavalia gladiata]|uniref:Uncharacterized protein n=1 Tax=Canavalia gladiata TaxID=3824 RepID=A0AAN9LP31_CANGL